jgi:RND family efflux transporter MFP subunit
MGERASKEQPRARSGRRARTAATAGLLVLTLAGTGCDDRAASPGARQASPPPPVEALPARSGRLPGQERVSGLVRARNQVAIRSEISAPIAAVLVESGDAVSAGDPLVRLVDDELRERLVQSEAALRIAEAEAAEARAVVAENQAEASRMRRLAEDRIVSQLDLETREARLDAARAQAAQAEARVARERSTVEERRAALERAVVRAPVAGRVDRRAAEVGRLATPATVLFLVGDPDEIVVEVPLTEEALRRIGVGSAALIRPRGDSPEPVQGSVARIAPFLRPETFSTIAEIDVDNREARLRPGMCVTVDLLHADVGLLTLVPAAAAWEDPLTGEPAAWVVSEPARLDPAVRELSERPLVVERRRLVVLGHGGGVLGVEDIEPGEWVVTVGQHLLHAADGGGEGPDGRVEAFVRPTDWERVLALQGLQREDLLRRFLEKQRRVAGSLGSAIPDRPEVVDDLLRPPGADARAEAPEPAPVRGPSADGAGSR